MVKKCDESNVEKKINFMYFVRINEKSHTSHPRKVIIQEDITDVRKGKFDGDASPKFMELSTRRVSVIS